MVTRVQDIEDNMEGPVTAEKDYKGKKKQVGLTSTKRETTTLKGDNKGYIIECREINNNK